MNIVRWPIFKKITERDFPSIKYRKKFYIKKEYPDISLEYIQNLLKLMGNKYIDVSNLKQEIIYKTNEDIINNKEIPKDELYNIKPPKHLKKYYVSATLLHSSNLEFLTDQPSIFNPFSYFQSPPSKPENLIIFIHGGGFIGMSTHSHEIFLRDWVNRLNIPIIGLNYGLSPQHKYPYGLNDCYQGYRWIINHCEDVIGFKPKKIILGGDSSGGTLILSLIYLLIAKNEFENENIRIPDLLLPLYPCCNTSIKNMGASLLLTLKDFLLNDSFLIMVNEAYRAFYENDDDPFLDPVKAKECLLKKLPKTVIQFGSFDPLRDDIVRLLAKIGKIKELDVKAYEFKEYCHGWNGGVNSEFLLKIPRELLFLEIKDIL
jgi:acetyl esterase/lipase